MGSLASVRQQVLEKKNLELKPFVLCLLIDFVLHPAYMKVLVKVATAHSFLVSQLTNPLTIVTIKKGTQNFIISLMLSPHIKKKRKNTLVKSDVLSILKPLIIHILSSLISRYLNLME